MEFKNVQIEYSSLNSIREILFVVFAIEIR